ncbi:hypothetical protein CBR_g52283 [Chara braunii]|uniref:Uncharacterized protein n=1 Tax=Chara braunii TaxID=69332 RepID=A0A388MA07_CHABU|nr:hypothetical protein CBR_g52283 [Chara braunii]|eukprot:GBG91396.1 hypothetical protein CBR_g52283 [Chara braunii]
MESSSSSSSKLSPSPSSAFSSPPSSSSSSASSSSLPASNYAPSRSGLSGQQDVARGRRPHRWVLRNPFVFRVGTTMTGVGVGCGVGIGVGRPINLAALPAVGPALGGGVSSIQGSLSGASGQVQKGVNLLGGKLGVKGLKAGIGCGVGIGYGFGVGLALKPGVGEEILNTLKDGVASLTEYVMTKWGPQDENRSEKAQQILSGMLLQGRAFGQQGSAVSSHVAGTAWPNREATTSSSPFVSAVAGQEASRAHKLSAQPSSLTQTAGGTAGSKLAGNDNRRKDGGQSRKHGDEDDMPSRMRVEVDRLQSENEQLRALLRHENEIAALRDENAALKRFLTEVLDVEVDGFRTFSSGSQDDMVLSRLRCFECRRRQRRR